ncbi:MAG: hypothetical protein AABX14_03555 [Candidatus Aenigmatarchaeota archaeon]
MELLESKNSKALKKLDINKHQGQIIGLADGKVVFTGKSIKEVMNVLRREYSDKRIGIASFPKKGKIMAW